MDLVADLSLPVLTVVEVPAKDVQFHPLKLKQSSQPRDFLPALGVAPGLNSHWEHH